MNKFQSWLKKFPAYQNMKEEDIFLSNDAEGDAVRMTHIAFEYPNLTYHAGWCKECQRVWLAIYDDWEQFMSYEFADMDGIT